MSDNKKPLIQKYLIPALIGYLNDCGQKPYMRVVVDDSEIMVPNMPQFQPEVVIPYTEPSNSRVRVMVLNMDPSALSGWCVMDEGLSFMTRFNGKAESLFIPFGSIVGICDFQNGKPSEYVNQDFVYDRARLTKTDKKEQPANTPVAPTPKKNHLSVVK